MRVMLFACLLVALLAGTFGPPTPWPDDLDELYRFVEEGAPGWVFTRPCGDGPLITWAQVKQIASANADGDTARVVISTARLDEIGLALPRAGVLDISERDLFGVALWVVFVQSWDYPYNPLCKPDGDRVGIYGRVADDLLVALGEYVR